MSKYTRTTFILFSICISLWSFLFATHVTASEPVLGSETAVLIDGDTGQVLFEKQSDKSMYPASITKLMTALLAIETLDPDDTITFSEAAIDSVDNGGSRIGIHPGEVLTVNDALHGLLLMSANEVANGLAEKTSQSIDKFVQDMNTRAKDLGAIHTNFTNPHGLFNVAHQTTAYDMALITKELIRHPYFLEIMADSTYEIPITNKSDETRLLYQQHKMLNTKNDLSIYRDDVIAGKVGYTSQSKNTLVTVARQRSRTLIAVIMRTEYNDLYADTAKLLDYGFNEYKHVPLLASDFLQTQPIQDNGMSIGTIDLMLNEDIELCIPVSAEREHLVYSLDLPTFSENALSANDLFGSVVLSIGAQELMQVPLRIKTVSYQVQDNIDDGLSDGALSETADSGSDSNATHETIGKNPWKPLILFVFIGVFALIGLVIKIV